MLFNFDCPGGNVGWEETCFCWCSSSKEVIIQPLGSSLSYKTAEWIPIKVYWYANTLHGTPNLWPGIKWLMSCVILLHSCHLWIHLGSAILQEPLHSAPCHCTCGKYFLNWSWDDSFLAQSTGSQWNGGSHYRQGWSHNTSNHTGHQSQVSIRKAHILSYGFL